MHCKTGVRSAETLAIVKGAGYADAVHVGGGVVGLGQPDRPVAAVVLTTLTPAVTDPASRVPVAESRDV